MDLAYIHTHDTPKNKKNQEGFILVIDIFSHFVGKSQISAISSNLIC